MFFYNEMDTRPLISSHQILKNPEVAAAADQVCHSAWLPTADRQNLAEARMVPACSAEEHLEEDRSRLVVAAAHQILAQSLEDHRSLLGLVVGELEDLMVGLRGVCLVLAVRGEAVLVEVVGLIGSCR